MRIETRFGTVELLDEGSKNYSFSSKDNLRQYRSEVNFSDEPRPPVVLGIQLDSNPEIALGGFGTGFHELNQHSALYLGDRLFVVFNSWLVCLELDPVQILWSVEADPFECFGVHYSAAHQAVITHGELEIARFDESGHKLWHVSGADIFSEGFKLEAEWIEAIDFNNAHYRFSYDSGLSLA